MATSPVYGWRYQGLSDPPNGATLGQNAVTDIEATMQARQAEIITAQANITALQALSPYRDRQTLGVAAASVTFSSIPTTLRSLRVLFRAGTSAGAASNVTMRINGNGAAVYTYYNAGSTDGADIAPAGGIVTEALVGVASGIVSTRFSSHEVVFPSWDQTTILNWHYHSYAWDGGLYARYGGGTYNAAGPYTSITLFCAAGNLIAGSDFQIIGERA
jgi:hypothetical protein